MRYINPSILYTHEKNSNSKVYSWMLLFLIHRDVLSNSTYFPFYGYNLIFCRCVSLSPIRFVLALHWFFWLFCLVNFRVSLLPPPVRHSFNAVCELCLFPNLLFSVFHARSNISKRLQMKYQSYNNTEMHYSIYMHEWYTPPNHAATGEREEILT